MNDLSKFVYFLRANCISENIKVFKDQDIDISKKDVAIVVVMMDVFIAGFFYASFIYLRYIEKITRDELEQNMTTANDFSV